MLISSLIALSAFVQQQPPGDWRRLGADNDEGIVISWNAAGVTRANGLTGVSVLVNRTGGDDRSYAVTKVELNCGASTARVVETANFEANGTPGPIDNARMEHRPIIANSMFATLRGLVCTGA